MALGHNLVSSIKKDLFSSQQARLWTYHLFVNLIALIVVIIPAGLKEYGRSHYGFCFVERDSKSEKLIISILALCLVYAFACVFYIMWCKPMFKSGRPIHGVIQSHYYSILILLLTWTPFMISAPLYWFHADYSPTHTIKLIAISFVITGPILIGLYRLSQKGVRQGFKSLCFDVSYQSEDKELNLTRMNTDLQDQNFLINADPTSPGQASGVSINP
eukprot:CAMPEP_0115013792 /NCGR_PEP_ID=MMETSP0216-20121206/25645_1 /TAXON_ID=223996 /ORGANISM="Protocruzia adherens, Strain Boccale" /LENGTH=216 /DNA_ID=CAMNT_0002383311 /DNA_START=285 /DNA_END=935 /DNA_ORIENTATION=+